MPEVIVFQHLQFQQVGLTLKMVQRTESGPMFPKSKSGEREHRGRKRYIEIGIIIKAISRVLKNNTNISNRKFNTLEFGSGDGFQLPYLKRLGRVIASDIYTSDGIKILRGINFVECDITDTPFKNRQFDVIFSNHVIEHINDLKSTFRETQRIGKSSCIYAFSVPTNIWLLLSIPAQYLGKMQRIITKTRKLLLKPTNSNKMITNKNNHYPDRRYQTHSNFTKYIRFIMPEGHGVNSNFLKCYRDFRIKRWKELFSENGFCIC